MTTTYCLGSKPIRLMTPDEIDFIRSRPLSCPGLPDCADGTPELSCPTDPCTGASACSAADIQGFPTWILADGQKFEGEKTLAELAKLTGYEAPGPGALPTAPGLDASSQLDSFLSQ